MPPPASCPLLCVSETLHGDLTVIFNSYRMLQVFNMLFSLSNDFLSYFLNNYLLSSETVVYSVFRETSLWLLPAFCQPSQCNCSLSSRLRNLSGFKTSCNFLHPVLLPAPFPSDVPARHGAAGSNDGQPPVSQPEQKATANVQQQFAKLCPELTLNQWAFG